MEVQALDEVDCEVLAIEVQLWKEYHLCLYGSSPVRQDLMRDGFGFEVRLNDQGLQLSRA
jgi:hypothetical protein